jgi:hypothetical protein
MKYKSDILLENAYSQVRENNLNIDGSEDNLTVNPHTKTFKEEKLLNCLKEFLSGGETLNHEIFPVAEKLLNYLENAKQTFGSEMSHQKSKSPIGLS